VSKLWQFSLAWLTQIDGYSLVLGAIIGCLLSYCLVFIALLLSGGDERPYDWRPEITKWRRG